MQNDWPLRLYSKSVLKQAKYKAIVSLLGPTAGLSCLDLGGDNGVVSYLLRQRGGRWKSADLDARSVRSIAALVGSDAYQIEGDRLPFADDEFDRVVVVDMLEHVSDDRAFVAELFRVLRPGGEVILNVPHGTPSLLRRFRHVIGQTDEKHGHLRPGYTRESLRSVLGERFTVEAQFTYSKFFSELIDTLINFGVSLLKGAGAASRKGIVVTGEDMRDYRGIFRLYTLIYPAIWLLGKLDNLLFFTGGYMLIARAGVNKETKTGSQPAAPRAAAQEQGVA